jgi:hypothetical protein
MHLFFYIPPVWWSPLMSWLSIAAWRRFFRWVTPGQLGALLVIIPTLEMCSHHLPVPRRILELSIGILKYYEYVYMYMDNMIYLWMFIYIYSFIHLFTIYEILWTSMKYWHLTSADICWGAIKVMICSSYEQNYLLLPMDMAKVLKWVVPYRLWSFSHDLQATCSEGCCPSTPCCAIVAPSHKCPQLHDSRHSPTQTDDSSPELLEIPEEIVIKNI